MGIDSEEIYNLFAKEGAVSGSMDVFIYRVVGQKADISEIKIKLTGLPLDFIDIYFEWKDEQNAPVVRKLYVTDRSY